LSRAHRVTLRSTRHRATLGRQLYVRTMRIHVPMGIVAAQMRTNSNRKNRVFARSRGYSLFTRLHCSIHRFVRRLLLFTQHFRPLKTDVFWLRYPGANARHCATFLARLRRAFPNAEQCRFSQAQSAPSDLFPHRRTATWAKTHLPFARGRLTSCSSWRSRFSHVVPQRRHRET